MRAERLLQVINDILADISRLRILRLFGQLESTLGRSTTDPSEENQAAVVRARTELTTALNRSRFNSYPASLRQILEELGVEKTVGAALASDIDDAFAGNNITPAFVLKKVQQERKYVEALQREARRYSRSLKYFEVGPDELDPGEFEITVAIPGKAVNCELGSFGRETIKIDKIMGVFSEIATGSRESFKIRAISSSDLTVFLDSLPAVAALVAASLERIATLYERVLSIIKLHREMKQKDLPADVLDPMKSHIDQAVKKGLEEIAVKLEEEHFSKMEKGRKQEIRKEIRHALEDLAARFGQRIPFRRSGSAT